MLPGNNKSKEEKAVRKLVTKAIRIHTIEDVIRAGGADKYARKINHTPLVKRDDIPALKLSEEELEAALAIGRRK
jgi:hypothetical protein